MQPIAQLKMSNVKYVPYVREEATSQVFAIFSISFSRNERRPIFRKIRYSILNF